MNAGARTHAVDIEGRRIVCYSSESPEVREFKKLGRRGYRFVTILEDGSNYCFVDIPY
jgi:hypothetical protein